MSEPVRTLRWTREDSSDPEPLISREWLVTNGLGGYASGTISGVNTRRYHGMLVAALPSPLGRMVILGHVSEQLRLPGPFIAKLGALERSGGALSFPARRFLREFRLEMGLPVWRYEVRGYVIEKRVFLPHLQNTVHLTYRLVDGRGPVRLMLRPAVHFRPHEAPVTHRPAGPVRFHALDDRYELHPADDLPALRMRLTGPRAVFTLDPRQIEGILYRMEESRGYEHTGMVWSPGYFRLLLPIGEEATMIASTESWEMVDALAPADALQAERERRQRLLAAADPASRDGVPAELVLAADQFVVTPVGRPAEATRAQASGDEARTVIAGYHWFTDWGRDTMISLEGLTLATGRTHEAGCILRTFAHHVRDGLIPNLFPEGEREGLYHTADATLWFFHAIDRYVETTGDRATLRLLLPTLADIIEHHVRGTRFGIGVDPRDGLLRQGAPGYQLTWMDAKVGQWVVTPRRGKAVEINALWYNALRLLEGWLASEQSREAARPIGAMAQRARQSFNERFWYGDGGYLYDVVDGEQGDDPACRPNQIFSIALKHPVLDPSRWEAILTVVRERLLTPVGLRSLAPGHPDYKSHYYGDLRARDAAYHQGTVWGWLIGPFVDAWLKVHPDEAHGALDLLEGFIPTLDQACVGTIGEVFDAESPYAPRGCVAQAWSVAEVLRTWVRTVHMINAVSLKAHPTTVGSG